MLLKAHDFTHSHVSQYFRAKFEKKKITNHSQSPQFSTCLMIIIGFSKHPKCLTVGEAGGHGILSQSTYTQNFKISWVILYYSKETLKSSKFFGTF